MVEDLQSALKKWSSSRDQREREREREKRKAVTVDWWRADEQLRRVDCC